jgi:hypothetical protein
MRRGVVAIKSYTTPTVSPRIIYNVTVEHSPTLVLAGLNGLFNSLTCIDGEQ